MTRLIATMIQVTTVNHQPLTPVFCWVTGARKNTTRIVTIVSPTSATVRAEPSIAILPRPIRNASQIRPTTAAHPTTRTRVESPPATSV